MKHPVLRLIVSWAVLGVGVALASAIVPGIGYDNGKTLLVVVVLLGLFNAFLRPILVLFTLPFVLLTLGLGLIVINALLLYAVGRWVDGFTVDGALAAVLGSLIISVTNMFLSRLTGTGPNIRVRGNVQFNRGAPRGRGPERIKDKDAIDV
jgi:putative membrane protein